MGVIFQSLEPSYGLVGSTPTYQARFIDDVSGLPTDPASVESLEVYASDGTLLRSYLPGMIVNPSVGLYQVLDIELDNVDVLQLKWTYIDGATTRSVLTAFEVVATTDNATEVQIKNHVLSQLGMGVMNVGLPAGTLNYCLIQAKNWYAMWHGQRSRTDLTLLPDQVEYDVADDCYYVVDVQIEGNATRVADALGTFGVYGFSQLGMSAIPAEDLYGIGGANGFYSSFVQSLQYSEMGRRILSAQFSWEWLGNPIKKLLVFPTPNATRMCKVDYVATAVDISSYDPHEYHFIQQYALAEAKEALGRIRSKFSSYATAQSDRSLDGEQLLAEATEMKLTLNDQILLHAPPGRIVTT